MERTVTPKTNGNGTTKHIQLNEAQTYQRQISFYTALVSRALLASRLGYQYGGDRDVYQALGYKKELVFTDYFTQYKRQDIAKAVIDKPIKGTWKDGFQVIEETENENDQTEFEIAWEDLDTRLQLHEVFLRLDKLTALGEYGVLFLGLDDVKNRDDLRVPVETTNTKLLYVQPLSQEHAKIKTYEKDTSNERFNLPKTYTITLTDPSSQNTSDVVVHYSRIIHVVRESLESAIIGIPKLEAVFNRLKDLEKIMGGDSEMFWRGARPGYFANVDDNYTLTDPKKKELKDQFDEFEHNLRRFLVTRGMDVKALAPQVSDPKGHVDVQLKMIASETEIPLRKLVGSERGELASSQDEEAWYQLLESLQSTHAIPHIIRPFIDTGIKYGFLPKLSNPYEIQFVDVRTTGDKEKAEIGKTRSEAIKNYTTNPFAAELIPPEAFMQYILGLQADEIQAIQRIIGTEMTAENQLSQGSQEDQSSV